MSVGDPTQGASSECSNSFYFGIGIAVGIGSSCIAVLALGCAFYGWKSKRRGTTNFTTKQEVQGEEGERLMRLNRRRSSSDLDNENTETVKA